MRIASRWYSSFILTRPFEEEERISLPTWTSWPLWAHHINVSEQSYSIQGQVDTPSSPVATSTS